MLPGTNRAADRFVRASFYVNAIPKTDDASLSVAAVSSVMRNVSVPYGISTPTNRTSPRRGGGRFVDHKALRYFFESALSPNAFWVDLKNLDFSAGVGPPT